MSFIETTLKERQKRGEVDLCKEMESIAQKFWDESKPSLVWGVAIQT